MTIKECQKRKHEYQRMLEDIDLLKLALVRNIAIEDTNIAALKKQAREQGMLKTVKCPSGVMVTKEDCEECGQCRPGPDFLN